MSDLDFQGRYNAHLFATYLAGLLVAKGILPLSGLAAAQDVMADALEDEDDCGTVQFNEPPNRFKDLQWDEQLRPKKSPD